jgi:hypothetical protein
MFPVEWLRLPQFSASILQIRNFLLFFKDLLHLLCVQKFSLLINYLSLLSGKFSCLRLTWRDIAHHRAVGCQRTPPERKLLKIKRKVSATSTTGVSRESHFHFIWTFALNFFYGHSLVDTLSFTKMTRIGLFCLYEWRERVTAWN